jgi:hypothetical protein
VLSQILSLVCKDIPFSTRLAFFKDQAISLFSYIYILVTQLEVQLHPLPEVSSLSIGGAHENFNHGIPFGNRSARVSVQQPSQR